MLGALTFVRHGLNSNMRQSVITALSRNIWTTYVARKSLVINSHEEFLDKVMHSDVPVIVNFHADWCDPCKILSPKLKELVEPLENVILAVVDVEKNVELVHTFEVKAVPAVLAIKNGIVVDKFIGLVDANMIEKLVNSLSESNSKQ